MRFSAVVAVALAPDSLTIIPPEKHFVNTFFIFFDKFFGHSLVKPYNVIFKIILLKTTFPSGNSLFAII